MDRVEGRIKMRCPIFRHTHDGLRFRVIYNIVFYILLFSMPFIHILNTRILYIYYIYIVYI